MYRNIGSLFQMTAVVAEGFLTSRDRADQLLPDWMLFKHLRKSRFHQRIDLGLGPGQQRRCLSATEFCPCCREHFGDYGKMLVVERREG
nr:hypothetical protein KS05_20850 [Rhizobium brockwellii]